MLGLQIMDKPTWILNTLAKKDQQYHHFLQTTRRGGGIPPFHPNYFLRRDNKEYCDQTSHCLVWEQHRLRQLDPRMDCENSWEDLHAPSITYTQHWISLADDPTHTHIIKDNSRILHPPSILLTAAPQFPLELIKTHFNMHYNIIRPLLHISTLKFKGIIWTTLCFFGTLILPSCCYWY